MASLRGVSISSYVSRGVSTSLKVLLHCNRFVFECMFVERDDRLLYFGYGVGSANVFVRWSHSRCILQMFGLQ